VSGAGLLGSTRVVVPATSANLGPGFDACGLALGLYDDVRVEITDGGLRIEVSGEDSGARDETHLVVRALRATFDALGADPPGLALTCVNRIPHSRGLGSSAAAIVAGVTAAAALVTGGLPPARALALACEIEGHPDNVAACLLGGFVVSWYDGGGPDAAGGRACRGEPRAARADVCPAVSPVVFVPEARQSTARSRAALPGSVPHADAAANAGRAALLALALTTRPDLLLRATEDRLHQPYRLPAMPATARLVARLRDAGIAAALSGSGPSVLALAADPGQAEAARTIAGPGFHAVPLAVDAAGARVVDDPVAGAERGPGT
jgi:homoserine kinase